MSASRIRGCMLGGALGDALGGPVEFSSLDEIRSRFGADGIVDLAPAYGRVGAITDDTQMTLFTAEGLLRAHNRSIDRGVCHPPTVIHHAYLRWLHTQGDVSPAIDSFRRLSEVWPDGWLVAVPGLHSRRAPGNTCLSALRARQPGTVERPVNQSKGCGAVMRAAPLGLLDVGHFELGVETGALTHGHPSGYLSAGVLAEVVGRLVRGESLAAAIAAADVLLREWPGADETRAAVTRAVEAAGRQEPGADVVESLGAGWVAEEALAISLYCALVADGFEHGVTLAVNHSGDSDSTGAITGNLLGALLGSDALPGRWLDRLELRDEIEQIAVDVIAHAAGRDEPSDHDRYPGW